jgi:DNA-binding MarR family transcriptional regulator
MTAARRLADLLVIAELEAAAALQLAHDGPLTHADLQTILDLSPGTATALTARLAHQALIRHEPDPDDPTGTRLRLSPGATLEIEAALAGLDAVSAR